MTEIEPRRGPGRPPKYVEAETNLPSRPQRKPFGALEQKMAYPGREGYHRHWFNEDRPGGIDRAREAGYEHVLDNEGKNVSKLVGKQENGHPQYAYLMEIPEEWYREDMKMQQQRIDETEESIKRGEFEKKDGDGRYVPSQGISIKHGQ